MVLGQAKGRDEVQHCGGKTLTLVSLREERLVYPQVKKRGIIPEFQIGLINISQVGGKGS